MEHKLMMKRFWQGYKECSACEKISVVENFCSECGNMLGRSYVELPIRTCEYCGEEVPDRNYCVNCGNKIGDFHKLPRKDPVLKKFTYGVCDTCGRMSAEGNHCSECGEMQGRVYIDLEFCTCSQCGEDTPKRTYCIYCGKILEKAARNKEYLDMLD